ncbi:hypothetical protein HXX76_006114 [Chlamydomonas incerta]|uniref:Uncharacterized protein n=1 Tax=Chlamydomonas incerta TaxID=51695 RepID=A0A835TBR8_CHLIN|nr:hypothetical protein HXX76_006114 [Chlamydomonas incerta]|eukprot:KAG2437464.1 hypothetical protein HXX76_006114 [Chlamydomonas incerta]
MANEPAGRPPWRTLLDEAASLRDLHGDSRVWELSSHHRDGRPPRLFLDPCGASVASMREWASLRCRLAGQQGRHWSSAPRSLMVSGLVQTGKTYTLNEVLPAVLAEALRAQPPDHPLAAMAVLRLNCLSLKLRAGAEGLLFSLLAEMMGWAEDARVPAPVLVLVDELQALLQPTTMNGRPDGTELDAAGGAYLRDGLLRQLLVAGPRHVLLALTGSGMAAVWGALAAMPVGGAAPLHCVRVVNLPSSSPPDLMLRLLEHSLPLWGLEAGDGGDVGGGIKAELMAWSGGSPALCTALAEGWISSGGGGGGGGPLAAYAPHFLRDELHAEVEVAWARSLAHLTNPQRGALLDLCCPELGACADDIADTGLWRFLQPHLTATAATAAAQDGGGSGGYFYLGDASQRQLLRTAIARYAGQLQRTGGWAGGLDSLEAGGLTLAQLDWGWQLLRLGEVAKHLQGATGGGGGGGAGADLSANMVLGVTEFTAMLEARAG